MNPDRSRRRSTGFCMADWDDDSSQLRDNLARVLRGTRDDAHRRRPPSLETARQWHVEIMQGLDLPEPKHAGAFRGESGLEQVQVRIDGHYGTPARQVAAELQDFESVLQRVIARLDELIPKDAEPDSDQLAAIIEVCAWAQAEWVRIHPFANGNGRTARVWVNSIAMRYGVPPFLSLRPRPAESYPSVCAKAMQGDWESTVPAFLEFLSQFCE